jgi:cytochrome c oxidase subunit 2
MWKIQHPQGKREINELHVPMDTPVKLTMTSEDVIHSFFVPAFRVKQDVLPGRYTYLWFTPNKLGSYHLFCTEYCGTEHSQMRGTVHVVSAAEYEAWLGGSVSAVAAGEEATPAQLGEAVFNKMGCMACHNAGSATLGPSLDNIVGKTQVMTDGSEALVDDNYLRESIVNSQAKVVKGYQPLMPVFRGTLNEEQIAQLIAYIKSRSAPPEAGQ